MVPLFYPPVRYTPRLDNQDGVSLRVLCERAGVACRASGEWIERKVSWEPVSEEAPMTITAEPGYMGSVHVRLPMRQAQSVTPKTVARQLLLAMAYGVFDGVARESVRGIDWSRQLAPVGRPRSIRRQSGAERQRAWRQRQQQEA